LIEIASDAGLVLAAWGNDGAHLDRARHVLPMLQRINPVYYLVINDTGQPKHPLGVIKSG
jgi:hypothetical protein